MSKKVLIIGGTRFFGKKLVQKLITNGDQVTVLSRGSASLDFTKGKVKHLALDRNLLLENKNLFSESQWDLLYDQICMNGKHASDLLEVFEGRAKKIIMTSTAAVYDFGSNLVEENYPIQNREMDYRTDLDYASGKRFAENVFFNQKITDKIAVRFPVVIGDDDYTERWKFYLDKVANEEEINVLNPKIDLTFIDSDEAADFLFWIGQQSFEGPINACSSGSVTLQDFIQFIGDQMNKKVRLKCVKDSEKRSPYCFGGDFSLSNKKATSMGYPFKSLKDVMKQEVRKYVKF